jgi:hypothetical protein
MESMRVQLSWLTADRALAAAAAQLAAIRPVAVLDHDVFAQCYVDLLKGLVTYKRSNPLISSKSTE